jgi:hypothetical protein
MPKRLADDEVTVTVGGQRVRLRPTLRAAMRLNNRPGGLAKLADDIAEGNFGTMADVIAATSSHAQIETEAVCDHVASCLSAGLAALRQPLLSLVYKLACLDPDDLGKGAEERQGGATTTFAEHYETLFKLATGALGWPPEVAWNATPAEISAAYQGRCDLLRMIFGSAEDKPDDKPAKSFGKLRQMFGGGKVKATS